MFPRGQLERKGAAHNGRKYSSLTCHLARIHRGVLWFRMAYYRVFFVFHRVTVYAVLYSLRDRYMQEHLPAGVRECYDFVLLAKGGATNLLLEKTVIGMQSSSALNRELVEVRIWGKPFSPCTCFFCVRRLMYLSVLSASCNMPV